MSIWTKYKPKIRSNIWNEPVGIRADIGTLIGFYSKLLKEIFKLWSLIKPKPSCKIIDSVKKLCSFNDMINKNMKLEWFSYTLTVRYSGPSFRLLSFKSNNICFHHPRQQHKYENLHLHPIKPDGITILVVYCPSWTIGIILNCINQIDIVSRVLWLFFYIHAYFIRPISWTVYKFHLHYKAVLLRVSRWN